MKIIQPKIKSRENMPTKVKIKVIKRYAVKNYETPVVTEKSPTKNAGREMVSTISSWVVEFQQRRRKETKQALDQLY